MSTLSTTVHRTVTAVNRNQWNNLVAQSELGTLFHRYEWLHALEVALDDVPHHVVVRDDGNPVAVWPNFLGSVSLPDQIEQRLSVELPLHAMHSVEPGYGGPVGAADTESIEHLFDALDASFGPTTLLHAFSMYDTRGARYGKYARSRGYESRLRFCVFLIDLRVGLSTVRENMAKERQKAIRRATDQSYRIDVAPLGAALDTTYDHYRQNMRRVGGTVLPRALFEALADRLADRVRVFTAVVDGREVGRYVYLLDDEGGVLHHWLSAIPDPDHYDYYPSELLHWFGLEWGLEHGYDRYSFGKTSPHFTDSVFRFKRKYGGRAVPVFEMERGNTRAGWPLYKLARRAFLGRTV
ncbi:GNAT family N-acetyltransferase [Halorarius litoreus]|uniref:GNAT family N-acetyltransferase n=1 Tax=Halorarius litoreus TaxID=2962676 RepID=UPI0020CBE1DD|nr:GNAT family N-acetyltransferase [Halorarius litoreus]